MRPLLTCLVEQLISVLCCHCEIELDSKPWLAESKEH